MFAGGTIIGATPDGRLAGTTLSDGTVSPAQGQDTHGPTAVLRSAAKIDQAYVFIYTAQYEAPSVILTTREDLKKLGSLIKTYAEWAGNGSSSMLSETSSCWMLRNLRRIIGT